jgi:hypothetical protein
MYTYLCLPQVKKFCEDLGGILNKDNVCELRPTGKDKNAVSISFLIRGSLE